MFYDNSRLGFIIKGVYPVDLSVGKFSEKGRRHSALSYRISGDSVFHCNGKQFELSDSTVVYIPKGVDYTRETHNPEKTVTVHFETFGDEEKEIEVIKGCKALESFFATLSEYWNRKEHTKCMRLVYKIFDEIQALSISSHPPVPNSIAKGVEYMETSFRLHDISVAEMARLCHVSETYFRRIFVAHFGTSPINALLNLRFNYAKSLLRSGYYQTKQVALLSGFSDTKYFRVAFKRRFGLTPNEYAEEYANF